MNIKDTFLKLTSETYPHGTEGRLVPLLPENLKTDRFGNYFLQIGESNCMFTSHLDTASYEKTKVNHVFSGNIIKTDGTSILGADDKAGVTVMMYMIHKNIPGLYYFFLGEERGCVGSKKLKNIFRELYPNITKVISFDRRGKDSIITHQASGRTASDEFARDLSTKLNSLGLGFSYRPDPTGIYTDSNEFSDIVSECTNISVGYQNEHTRSELQDILHLENLCKGVIQIDWENIVTKRDPKKNDYLGWGSTDLYNSHWNDYSTNYTTHKTQSYYDNLYGVDLDFELDSLTSSEDMDNDDIITISEIEKLLNIMEIEYDSVSWDGENCYYEYLSEVHYFANKDTLLDFIDFYLYDSNPE